MQFIVEVPVYLKFDVTAPDATAAGMVGEELALAAAGQPKSTFFTVATLSGLGTVHGVSVVLPDEDDRDADVYVCRGGKLSYVTPAGVPEPIDEDCSL